MRPSWDEYFMHMAVMISTRSTCDRRRVGCVLVSPQWNVVSTGYNGSAPGTEHCDDTGHIMHDGHCVRTIHAERNAIAHAAKRGVATDRTTAYITTMPCPTCITDLVAAGIKSVVFLEGYHDEEDQVTRRLAAASGVVLYEYDGRKTWESPIDR